MRSRSRSTNIFTATDCTRPADKPGEIFFHNNGETVYPANLSKILLVSWACTNFISISRVFSNAFKTASLVISRNAILLTGTFGFSTSSKCHEIASPSRSSSVARINSSTSFNLSFSLLTIFFLSGGVT